MRQRKKTTAAWLLGVTMLVGSIGQSMPTFAADSDLEISAKAATVQLTDDEVDRLIGETNYQRSSVHDPSVIVAEKDGENDYYVFGSHIAVSETSDLMNWNSLITDNQENCTLFADASGNVVSFNDAFTSNAYTGKVDVRTQDGTIVEADFGSYNAAEWIEDHTVNGNMWAPDIIYNPTMDKWCMYLSLNGLVWNSNIILLTADDVEGPYVYQGPVVFTGFDKVGTEKSYKKTDLELVTGELDELPDKYVKLLDSSLPVGNWGEYLPHAIDPCVYYDDEGNLWMAYGSWSGGIYVLELDETTGLRDYTVQYEDTSNLGKDITSDPYFGKKIAGGWYVSGEGPYIEKIGDYYYLFMSYGFYSPEGGYNMRVFRSESPDGPFVDTNGTSAIFTGGYVHNYNGDDNRGLKLMGNYKWDTMEKAEVAQGHNSAFVDSDGKAYVVYHTKFNDGSASHELRVHQLFVNEDGWIVAAPYEYGGETLSTTPYSSAELIGSYDLIIHNYEEDFENLAYESPVTIYLDADGTVSGAATGTWTQAQDSVNATITLDGKTYKGVFVKQKISQTQVETMCFTAANSDGLCIWGSKTCSDNVIVAQNAKMLDFNLPANTYEDLTLPTESMGDAVVTWRSNNPSVISNSGKVTTQQQDVDVVMTCVISKGAYYYEKDYTVTVKAGQQDNTEPMLVGSYFENQEVDLSNYANGGLAVRNPFYKGSYGGLDLSGGVKIEFDVTNNADPKDFALAALISFSGTSGKLYFTAGSYLGYNATGGWYDANLNNYQLATDYIQDKDPAHVVLEFTKDGFSVTVDGVLAYDQTMLGQPNSDFTLMDHSQVLNWLYETADTLDFGRGSWWTSVAQSTISNVKCYVNPVESTSSSSSDSIEKETVVLNSDSFLQIMDNPFYGKELENLYVHYTINWNENSVKDGWNGLFSFYNSDTTGRVSFQSAPYICYNGADGTWLDCNKPGLTGGTNVAEAFVPGNDYTFDIVLSKDGVEVSVDGTPIALGEESSSATYETMLDYVSKCSKFTLGVGNQKSSYWATEVCTLKDLYIGTNPYGEQEGLLSVQYATHVQDYGWQDYAADGALSGTSGKSKRLEAIRINLANNNLAGSIEYRTHVQNEGWQSYVADGTLSGTTGKNLRLEAIQIRLTGELAEKYDVYYRTHLQDLGWLGWASNDGKSGSAGLSKRLEGIQIRLVEKGAEAPGSTDNAYVTNKKDPNPSIMYTTHVQNKGWQDEVKDGVMAGTKGKSLRLEGIKIRVNGDGLNGGVEYSTHVQNEGWQDYVANGALSGTTGKNLRLEAIKIRLTGELAEKYSVEYRTHVQNEGWQKWVKDDAMSGTKGKSLRLEGIEIRLVKK